MVRGNSPVPNLGARNAKKLTIQVMDFPLLATDYDSGSNSIYETFAETPGENSHIACTYRSYKDKTQSVIFKAVAI